MQDSILTTVVKDIDGEVTTLEKYAGNVLLIVNVASKCGLTPQYEQLENIQKQRKFITTILQAMKKEFSAKQLSMQ